MGFICTPAGFRQPDAKNGVMKRAAIFIQLLLLFSAQAVYSQTIETKIFDNLEWRNIGPANMGGRVTDIEGISGNPYTVYVGTASGGFWKTSNMGVSWTPLFERYGTLSVGDFALDPQNPDVIWLGTGESNTRNSVSFGNGIYRSPDGGKTWTFKGLRDTRHIARVIVHPKNSDIVYVAAVGHAYGANEERGVFMTTDGGTTWQKVLYIDSGHGACDMDIDPSNPNILYAAMWRFERKPWTHTSGSEQGGVFKSVDGGRTWKKLENGLPKLLGRIGVKVAPSNPNVVYAICESREGTLYRSDDRGENFQLMTRETNIVSRGFYYADMRVDPTDENRVYAIATSFLVSIDGGRTFNTIANRIHSDHHSLWVDPKNPNFLWLGNDGGIAFSVDRGVSWDAVSNIPLGQFYQIGISHTEPFYTVAGGLQDNGTWAGPARSREGAIVNEFWQMVSFGDGFHVIIHPENPNLFISESQGGSILRVDLTSSTQQNISPQPRRNDGGPVGDLPYRFNWNTPIVLSPHDKNTVYAGANVLFKSTDFGSTWQVISPDLTTNDKEKQKDAGGPVWIENTTAEYHCTIISIAESPLGSGVIWVGTDDGNLQVTRDGGRSWVNLIKNVPSLRENSPVSHVEPSRKDPNLVYVSFDRHMLNDLSPYIYKTTDGGRTWVKITRGLPENAYVWVVREDPMNPALLYCGTEIGLFVSFDSGGNWTKLQLKNLPDVSIHDLLVHPLTNDLILGTHGRSIWVWDDVTPLQQISTEVLQKEEHLFAPRTAWRYSGRFGRFGSGDRPLRAPNPPYGALIFYYLKEKPDKTPVKLQILDIQGNVLRELNDIPKEAGINRAVWDLRLGPRTPSEGQDTPRPFGGGRGGGGGAGPQALPGNYRVRLLAGDRQQEQPLLLRLDRSLEPYAGNIQVGHQLALEGREMVDTLNQSMQIVNSIDTQIKNLRQTAREQQITIPDDVSKMMDEHIAKIELMKNKVENPQGVPFYSRGPKLRSRLSSAVGAMDSNTGPTLAQMEYYDAVKKEYDEFMVQVRDYLAKEIPALNEKLKQNGLPVILAGQIR